MVYRLYRKLLLGIADVDLTENGKNRINEYRKEIDNYRIEIIYTSPYIRVYQTAQILNRDIKVELKVFVLTILISVTQQESENIYNHVKLGLKAKI